jgi:hypothetical protein
MDHIARLQLVGSVLAQREMEKRRSPLVSIPPFGRGFSRHRGLSIRWRLVGARTSPHAPVHRLDEPTGVSLGMVASPQCPPPFRPARLIVAPQWRVCRFSTSGWPVTPPCEYNST